MKVAILGAAHQHVDYALAEVALRDELELVAASEPDPQPAERFLGGVGVPLYDTPQRGWRPMTSMSRSSPGSTASALRPPSQRCEPEPCAGRQAARTSLEQLEAIREAAEVSGRHVSIVFEKRFYPATLALRAWWPTVCSAASRWSPRPARTS